MADNSKQQSRTFSGFDQKIGWGTRVAYAGGDVACNIVFGMIGTLLTYFYTKMGVNIAAVGIVMLASRVFDGVSDVVMGIIVDKTHSRFGKARPWLLWMSIPFCASAVLLFTLPVNLPADQAWVQILYIAISYNFCNTVCYTAINLPYGTLSTLMTRSSHERDMLGNVRMGLSPLGKIIGVTLTPIVVGYLGGIENRDAWIKTMSIWAAVAFILLLINFIFCKEKVNPELMNKEAKVEAKKKEEKPKTNKLPMKQALKFLIKNQYFWAVLLLWMFQSVSFSVVGTTLPYFTEWILGDKGQTQYSTFFLIETLTLVGGVFVCMPLVKKVGKRNLALGGAILALLGQIVFIFFPRNPGMLYAICIIRSIGLAPLNAVVFGMLGDVVDFGHWKNNVRQEAFISAGGSVGTKLGAGLASVLITQLLNFAGFIEGTTDHQPDSAIKMIEGLYVWGPLIIAAGVVLVLIFYKLDKKYDAMMLALTKREWEEESKKAGTQKDIAAVKKNPAPIDPELAKLMAEMKPLEGKESPLAKKEESKDKKKK